MSCPQKRSTETEQIIATVQQGFSVLQSASDGDKAGAVSKGFSILLSARPKRNLRGKCSKCKKRGHVVKNCWFAKKQHKTTEDAPAAKRQTTMKNAVNVDGVVAETQGSSQMDERTTSVSEPTKELATEDVVEVAIVEAKSDSEKRHESKP